ncbi:hypothetical protein [Frigoriglobus tundricola]|uniref:Uncharacterized protein n=1 Tax=Frigoriglobus tundricola TaxID=2774151 RepID=A0A6M5YQ12_9BACT|nr:hypothetical protein [Frigoriglobus tundricola]QJW96129.1 hypothetical protein FTUN_3684 [Frigoriglobus tundricola]
MATRMCTMAGLVVAFASVAAGQDFKLHTSTAGKYKANFPGEVKSETTDIQAGNQTLKLTLETVELKGETVFMVSYVDAADEVAKQPAGPRLDKVRDGNKGPTGKVLEDKDVTVGAEKYPGRDILLETPGRFIRNRAVIAGNRLYQVMVQGTKDVVTSPSADKFIASFEITK